MRKSLRTLIVEDSENDCELLLRALRQGGYAVSHRRVETAPEMRSALANESWDIVLADWTLPEFSAPGARTVLSESGIDLPFIVVSGTIGEETAVVALKAGAHDFMVKDNTSRLPFAVDRELRAAEIRASGRRTHAELARSERLLRLMNDMVIEGVIAVDHRGKCILWNRAADALLGKGSTDLALELWASHYGFFLADRVTPCAPESLPLARALGGARVDGERLCVRNAVLPEGAQLHVDARPLRDQEGEIQGAVSILRPAP